jgi:hypothetical protein
MLGRSLMDGFCGFWMEIFAIKVLSHCFLDDVSEFSAIYSYAIDVSW